MKQNCEFKTKHTHPCAIDLDADAATFPGRAVPSPSGAGLTGCAGNAPQENEGAPRPQPRANCTQNPKTCERAASAGKDAASSKSREGCSAAPRAQPQQRDAGANSEWPVLRGPGPGGAERTGGTASAVATNTKRAPGTQVQGGGWSRPRRRTRGPGAQKQVGAAATSQAAAGTPRAGRRRLARSWGSPAFRPAPEGRARHLWPADPGVGLDTPARAPGRRPQAPGPAPHRRSHPQRPQPQPARPADRLAGGTGQPPPSLLRPRPWGSHSRGARVPCGPAPGLDPGSAGAPCVLLRASPRGRVCAARGAPPRGRPWRPRVVLPLCGGAEPFPRSLGPQQGCSRVCLPGVPGAAAGAE